MRATARGSVYRAAPMTAPPAPPTRSATYGAGALAGAGLGLLAIIALLAGLSIVVRDANARAKEDRMVAGKISVVGAAKLREWTSDRVSVQVPSGWGLIATGKVAFSPNLINKYGQVVLHRWRSSLDEPPADNACEQGLVCFEIQYETPRATGTIVGTQVVNTAKKPWEFASKTSRELTTNANADARERFVDLGPVVVPQDRWMWRLTTRLRDQQRVRYLFATCQGGRVDRFWTIGFYASAQDDLTDEISDVLRSLELDAPTPKRPERTTQRAKGERIDSDCSDVLDPAS